MKKISQVFDKCGKTMRVLVYVPKKISKKQTRPINTTPSHLTGKQCFVRATPCLVSQNLRNERCQQDLALGPTKLTFGAN